MKIRITCRCNARFDLYSNGRNKQIYTCPNCGTALPSNASEDLHNAFAAFELFAAKLDEKELYEVEFLNN